MADHSLRFPRALASVCVTALAGSMLIAAPSHADPDIETVQTRVDRLYHQAEKASERYNAARLEMRTARHRLSGLEKHLARQKAKVATVRQQVASSVVAQYQGQALSSTTQLMLSADPQDFLDQLTAVANFNDQRTQMMDEFALQATRLAVQEKAAEREVVKITSTKRRLGEEKARIDERSSEAKTLLTTLEQRAERRASRAAAREARAQEQAAAARTSSESSSSSAPAASPAAAPASGRAAVAVRYALAQVGKSYVYGAAGPSAFDCSGLTMRAWQAAGVSLPHQSGAQMGSGTPVSQSALQPGDLVFYYSPVSHVGMYVGNGQVVNALNPSSGIRVSPLNMMPYAGAVRPG